MRTAFLCFAIANRSQFMHNSSQARQLDPHSMKSGVDFADRAPEGATPSSPRALSWGLLEGGDARCVAPSFFASLSAGLFVGSLHWDPAPWRSARMYDGRRILPGGGARRRRARSAAFAGRDSAAGGASCGQSSPSHSGERLTSGMIRRAAGRPPWGTCGA